MINFFLTVFSSILLTFAFPQFNFFPLIWVGLVPFLIALENKSMRESFCLGYLAGIVYFSIMIYWLMYVTVPGAGLFVLYLALYFALFALGVRLSRSFPLVLKAFFLAAYWVLLEYLRGFLFTGFGWAALGQSQVPFLPVIQIADLFGMEGVTFIIVFINVCIKEVLIFLRRRHVETFEINSLVIISVIIFSSVLIYGTVRLSMMNFERFVSVGVVQGNIEQAEKWDEQLWPEIMRKHKVLTQSIVHKENPDIIIWPETSYPGILWDDIDLFKELLFDVRAMDTPLLIGAVLVRNGQYFNSALLVDRYGTLNQIYDKKHLVPFGEFLPLRKIFSFLENIAPIGDFTPGESFTVFNLPQNQTKFSVLICFEDTVAYLARNFVREGAQFLVNITNDAWFSDSKAPFLHLYSAVFRSVENRRSLVRAANTGVSAFIGPSGEVFKMAENGGKSIFISAVEAYRMPINDEITIFTKYPQFFIYFCFAWLVSGLIYAVRKREK